MRRPREQDQTKSIAFTIAVIALGAKLAKADGVVTRDEVAAFKEVFHIPPEEAKNVGKFFDRAKRDTIGFELYAKQIAGMFRDNPPVLEELLDCLFHIARADGVYHPGEKAYLRRVAEIFGFDATEFRRIEARNMGPDKADPYVVLGVERTASDAEVKAAYRTLIKEHCHLVKTSRRHQRFIALQVDHELLIRPGQLCCAFCNSVAAAFVIRACQYNLCAKTLSSPDNTLIIGGDDNGNRCGFSGT